MQVIDSWPHPSSQTRVAGDQRLIYALLDECSHGQIALSDGGVADGLIGRWLHGSRFDLSTGEPTRTAVTRPVPAYPTWVADSAPSKSV